MPEENKDKKLTKAEEQKLHVYFVEKVITLMTGAMGLVAALAWNDAIQTLFRVLFPKSEGVTGKFIYAIIVTFIVVFISSQLRKIEDKEEK